MQYGIYTVNETAQEKKGGRIIGNNSRVVVLDIQPQNHVLVCRLGDYLDTFIISEDLLR